MRNRITSRESEAAEILKAVDVLERSVQCATDESSLKSEADREGLKLYAAVAEAIQAWVERKRAERRAA